MSRSVAEWSKKIVLGTGRFGDLNSNLTVTRITSFYQDYLFCDKRVPKTGTEVCILSKLFAKLTLGGNNSSNISEWRPIGFRVVTNKLFTVSF